MAEQLELFTDIERQVIVLAASSSRECVSVASNPARRGLDWLVRKLAGDTSANPLANERLEALRRLACTTFATGGRPAETSIRSAIDAGFSSDQIEGLKRLASGLQPQFG
jgi:hypothetical protein